MTTVRRSLLSFGLAFSLWANAPAAANTYVVSTTPGPGVDFTDIPPAIAFAQTGDVILVLDGVYSGFSLQKGLTIVGRPNVSISGWLDVRHVPAGQRAVIVAVQAPRVSVFLCTGKVVLQELGRPDGITISNSSDVRIARTDVGCVPGVNLVDSLDAIQLLEGRLELVGSTVGGHFGMSHAGTGGHGDAGGAGIRIWGQSRLVASAVQITGGRGSIESTPNIASGRGGPAIAMDGPVPSVVLGRSSRLEGGQEGVNSYYSNCDFGAPPGFAVEGTGAAGHYLLTSDTTLSTPPFHQGAGCAVYQGPLVWAILHTIATPADPVLEASAAPAPGGTITFTVFGEPGSSSVLLLGRSMVVEPVAGSPVERLVGSARRLPLPVMPAAGFVTRSLALPASLPRGFVFFAQAEVVGPNGLRHTNSMPIVLR